MTSIEEEHETSFSQNNKVLSHLSFKFNRSIEVSTPSKALLYLSCFIMLILDRQKIQTSALLHKTMMPTYCLWMEKACRSMLLPTPLIFPCMFVLVSDILLHLYMVLLEVVLQTWSARVESTQILIFVVQNIGKVIMLKKIMHPGPKEDKHNQILMSAVQNVFHNSDSKLPWHHI